MRRGTLTFLAGHDGRAQGRIQLLAGVVRAAPSSKRRDHTTRAPRADVPPDNRRGGEATAQNCMRRAQVPTQQRARVKANDTTGGDENMDEDNGAEEDGNDGDEEDGGRHRNK